MGLTGFLIPAKIVGGGVAGISTLLFYSFNLPVSITYFGISVFLILVSMKYLGPKFGIKTIYSVAMLSLLIYLFQNFITTPLVSETFMATIIGAVLSGIGIGIVFTQGGSTGGTEIIALIVNKANHVSPGKTLIACDIIIIASSYFVFGSIEKIIYGYVSVAIVGYVIDTILVGAKQSIQLTIFSKKHTEIANKVGRSGVRGLTKLKAQGWYSQENYDVLLVVIRKYELKFFISLVNETDPDAFISMGNVVGVYGKGFDRLKA